MQNENEKDFTEELLSKNIKFLRTAVGLDINELAEITSTDAVRILEPE